MNNNPNLNEEENIKQEVENFKNSKKFRYMNRLNVDTKSNMLNRILIGIMLVVIVVPCLVVGNYVFLALILFAGLIACHEIINVPQSIDHKFNKAVYAFSYFMMGALIFWIILKNNIIVNLEEYSKNPNNFNIVFDLTNGFYGARISLTNFFICILFFFIQVLFDKNFTIHDCFYFCAMLFLVGMGFQSILFLRYAPFAYSGITVYQATASFRYGQSMLLIFYMLMGACMNDVGAYFIGVLFGKHKMAPRISPKKTWEGFIGGVIISFTATITFAFVLDHFDLPMIEGILDREHWYNVLIISLMMPIMSVFGDLIFSQIKRSYGIKDFGRALQSHGGILDRLDSILIVSITMALLIEAMGKGWQIFRPEELIWLIS